MTNPVQIIMERIPNQERANELMSQLFPVADTRRVFSEPVTQGDYTVITANEVSVTIGFGYGGGGGLEEQELEEAMQPDAPGKGGFGGGGGGGGASFARPVAVIEIGPHGVRVEPIVDPTKIALAFFTAFGSMFVMLRKMRRQGSGK